MNKRLLLLLIWVGLISFTASSQTFTYRTSLKDMCGDPGDIFTCTISFTNTSSSPINIFVNRYQKTTPAYWYSCYCYNQCNLPSRDTITISIPAFTVDMMAVQFKTDSVNPGLSTGDFTIYQVGFQNNEDSFHLEASTICNLANGIHEVAVNNNSFNVFPNPTSNLINIVLNENNAAEKQEFLVCNVIGQPIASILIEQNQPGFSIDMSSYDAGIYFIRLKTPYGIQTKKIIKQ